LPPPPLSGGAGEAALPLPVLTGSAGETGTRATRAARETRLERERERDTVAPAAVCERETSPIQAAQWIQDSAGGWMLERDRGRERPGPRERDGDGGSMSANRPVRLEARETGA